MNQRKLLALVIVVCLGVAGSVAWFLAGEYETAKARAESRPAPVPTSEALRPGHAAVGRVAAAPLRETPRVSGS
ncbi:MAG: hypothetical protein IT454_11160 [Planctomycetes bacterium]|nr:hypothetical protein [Planctomycetota bacterium]